MEILNFFHPGILLHKIGPLALFLLIFIEEAGVPLPIPGDFLIIVEGRSSLHGGLGFFSVLVLVTLGTLLGASILYGFSRVLGRELIMKYGKFLRFDEKRLTKIENWFKKYGGIMIVIGRLVPGLRTLTSIVAGIFAVPYLLFLIYTTIAAVIWVVVYFLIGRFVGQKFPLILHLALARLSLTIVGLLLVVLLIVWFLRRVRSK